MRCHSLASHLCRAVFVACVLTVLCSLAPALSRADQVTLAWNANTDPDLAGYKLYYGTSSGSYPLSVDVGNVTSHTLSGLLEGQTYYFAATAYNLSLNESGFSNEVSKAIADVTPPTVSISAPANGATVSGTAVTVSASASDNVGVAGVQFKLDGANLGAEVTAAPYSVSWNTTLGAAGAHTLTAVARDAAGNVATSAAVSVTVANDTTPPVISSVSAFNISSSAATITWATNQASDSQVDYGLTTAYGATTPLNSTLATAHAVTLTGLLATTTYHYRVKSRDAAGNLATSADFTLTTLTVNNPVPDATPPTVSITSPANGATVSGTITVSGTAADNAAVSQVAVSVDGAFYTLAAGTVSWSFSLNTSYLSNGSHTLIARATDSSGNTATSAPLSVTVSSGGIQAIFSMNVAVGTNPFTVTTPGNYILTGLVYAPSEAANSFYVDIDSDPAGINAKVWDLTISTTFVPENVSSRGICDYTCAQFNPKVFTLAAGAHTLYIQPRETGTQIQSVTFSLPTSADITPPTVSFNAPAAGSTVAGTITVSASATDNVGVVGVQFKLDGTNLGAELTTAPYTFSWNTTTTTNAAHSLTAVARDAAGNATTSSVVSITVANGDTIPPTVAITAPVDGANVVGFTIISAQAADNVAVNNVQIYADSALIGTVACGATLSCSGSVKWNINGPPGVPHSIYAVATDTSGNSSSSMTITVFK